MIDINEIRDRLIKTVIENKLEHINSAILEDYEAYEIIIDIRIEKTAVPSSQDGLTKSAAPPSKAAVSYISSS